MKYETDLTRWRLIGSEDGSVVWKYLKEEEIEGSREQTYYEKYFLGLDLPETNSTKPLTTSLDYASSVFSFLKSLQLEQGFWTCEYGGPLFLLPGLIISLYSVEESLDNCYKTEIIRYLLSFVNKDDGYGLHTEHHATCYGTVMNYVALRLLGVEKEDLKLQKIRNRIQKLGGAEGLPTWGKVQLSCIGLYEWEGVNPIPAETWLLPYYLSPFHPGKMWVHSRNVMLSMCYLYSVKYKPKKDISQLIRDLRKEIYKNNYDKITWKDLKNRVCEKDLYVKHSSLMNITNKILSIYETLTIPVFPFLRNMGIKEVINQIDYEDENTKYLDIGPVNKSMNMMCIYHAYGKESSKFKKHLKKIYDYLFLGKQGMMMNGTNGVQLWDTAFIVQAAYECRFNTKEEDKQCLRKAYTFIDHMQIKSNSIHYPYDYRHQSKGAWPFSTRDQSYTVSDCTAEGLKAVLCLKDEPYIHNKIPYNRLCDAIDILLSLQNNNGGVASYEKIRGQGFYELLNSAEVFADIMIEYSYPECTTAFLLALTSFNKLYPEYKHIQIKKAQQKALGFIKSIQKEDGSWYGSWGICFTYATFFAVESLCTFGENYSNSSNVKRACDFLIEKQNTDGGWGESFKSCETKIYSNTHSQTVNTSWAILTLLKADYPLRSKIDKAVTKLAQNINKNNGSFDQQLIEGVFNKNCMISYPNYKLYFPMWAFGRYAEKYNNPPINITQSD